jgi:hypothetical protein
MIPFRFIKLTETMSQNCNFCFKMQRFVLKADGINAGIQFSIQLEYRKSTTMWTLPNRKTWQENLTKLALDQKTLSSNLETATLKISESYFTHRRDFLSASGEEKELKKSYDDKITAYQTEIEKLQPGVDAASKSLDEAELAYQQAKAKFDELKAKQDLIVSQKKDAIGSKKQLEDGAEFKNLQTASADNNTKGKAEYPQVEAKLDEGKTLNLGSQVAGIFDKLKGILKAGQDATTAPAADAERPNFNTKYAEISN